MSANDSSRFHELAERISLLSQRKRNPDLTTVDTTVVLTQQDNFVSQRLEDVLSQCQTDSEIDSELWDDLEIHHRSADVYINQYLDCLHQVQEERCKHVYEVEDLNHEAFPKDVAVRNQNSKASAMTRAEWQLKISRDSLARDLLAMHETLGFLKMRTTPTPSNSGLSICILSVSASLLFIKWRNFPPLETLGALTFDALSLGAYYYSHKMRKWLRMKSIEHYQENIEGLLRRLNKNELDEEDRTGLSGMWCRMMD